MKVHVVQKVMRANDEHAETVRKRLREAGVIAVNIMSAPGSGKTSLIEAALAHRPGESAIGVIEGDPETSLDAERIAPFGVPVVQIQTSGGCHLEAHLILRALDNFDLPKIRLLIIENVGNLVCPVEFDLGETYRVAVVSVPEGHDKPMKYPNLFRRADAVVLNKIDLIPYVNFDKARFEDSLEKLNPNLSHFETSCTSHAGVNQWAEWLRSLEFLGEGRSQAAVRHA